MCIAQDHRYKRSRCKALPPSFKKTRRPSIGSAIKKSVAHSAASIPTIPSSSAAASINPKTSAGPTEEAPKHQSPASKALPKLDDETIPLPLEVKLAPRPSIFRPLVALTHKCDEVSTLPIEDLLTLRRTKSFDEDRDDKYSITWTRKGIEKFQQNARSDIRKSNVKIELDFLRDVPAGGILDLPRSRKESNNVVNQTVSSRPSSSDLTEHMSNLTVRPEPLDTSLCLTPPGVLMSPCYPNLKTPPTPRHCMPLNPLCQYTEFQIPPHLFLPDFFE